MLARTAVIALVLLLSQAFAGVALAAPPVAVSEAEDGTTVALSVGDALDVVLRGNPTTGFTWELVSEDLGAIQVAGEPDYVTDRAIPGSPGTFTFHFLAVEAGTVDLSFVYRQPWVTDQPPARAYAITVEVSEIE